MNMSMQNLLEQPRAATRTAACGLALLLAACGSIGDGSTVESLKLVYSPTDRDQAGLLDAGLATQKLRMYDCFCANVTAVGTFTDGTLANFNSRAHWSTSDPAIVTALNYPETNTLCPLAQQGAGMLTPHAPGTAVVSAEYLGMKADMTVEVTDTAAVAAAGGSAFVLKPTDTANAGEVAVGALLPLDLYVTLDNRPRALRLNVMTFAFNPVADTVATIDTIGRVAGLSADAGTPLNATAAFGTCGVTASVPIRVGEVVEPMAIAEEPGFTTDQRLAVNSNELLQVTAPLDFDGDGTADGSQIVSDQSRADYTDPCTMRSFDANVPTSNCSEVAATCASTVPVCSAGQTTCSSGMTACRTVAAPIVSSGLNRVIAASASANPTSLFATFPGFVGVPTTLASPIGAADTLVTVAALAGYPAIYPWEAVIDKDTAPEVVQVTARDGTTNNLTVVRGYAGTTAQAHASGAPLVQRSFGSDTVGVTATDGTLTTMTIDSAPSSLNPFATLQLEATGTYEDTTAMTSRTQHVTHVATFATNSPAMVWSSSAPGVAVVSAGTGLVTAVSACGGTAVVRARISTSVNEDDKAFVAPAVTGDATDLDSNGNTDANDTACTTTDPLCDQVTLTVPASNPLPPGTTCP